MTDHIDINMALLSCLFYHVRYSLDGIEKESDFYLEMEWQDNFMAMNIEGLD